MRETKSLSQPCISTYSHVDFLAYTSMIVERTKSEFLQFLLSWKQNACLDVTESVLGKMEQKEIGFPYSVSHSYCKGKCPTLTLMVCLLRESTRALILLLLCTQVCMKLRISVCLISSVYISLPAIKRCPLCSGDTIQKVSTMVLRAVHRNCSLQLSPQLSFLKQSSVQWSPLQTVTAKLSTRKLPRSGKSQAWGSVSDQ